MLSLEIISWMFHVSMGVGGGCFSDGGGASFLSGGTSVLVRGGRGFKRNRKMVGHPSTMGNPDTGR